MFTHYGEYMFETSSDSEDGGRRKRDDEPDDAIEIVEGQQFDDSGTANTTAETYDGLTTMSSSLYPNIYQLDVPWGFTPRNAQLYEVGRFGYTGPIYGGKLTLQKDTIAGVPNVTSHAPSGIGWITTAAWNASTWNGVPYDVTGKTTAQICSWVFPTANTMRGLRQLYESAPPFADARFPKAWEIDLWNIKVINHFRALLGIGPITPSYRLYVEAQWATERRWSPRWNAYPANGQAVYGPCPNGNPHCGAQFVPGEGDQGWYLLPGGTGFTPSMVRQSTNECLGGTNTNIPWSIKLARVIAIFLCSEGLVGHTGPFLRRSKVGMIWHDLGDGTSQLRIKFGGTYTPFAGV